MDDPPSPKLSADTPAMRRCAGKNRPVQIAKQGGRKLFGKEAKEIFLEWFAATCNVRLSAEKAGVSYPTPFRHRMNHEAFAFAWDRALQQGYARLEARLLQEVYVPSLANQELDVRAGLDDPGVEEAFDTQLAIILLREHARRLPGSPDRQKRQRTRAETATAKEVAEALRKRLKAFALRQQSARSGKKS